MEGTVEFQSRTCKREGMPWSRRIILEAKSRLGAFIRKWGKKTNVARALI
jgi:hypothetical protein